MLLEHALEEDACWKAIVHAFKNLTGGEVWLFIVARVLIGFAVGIFAMIYFPTTAIYLAWPALGIGIVLFVLASKGLLRKRPSGPAA